MVFVFRTSVTFEHQVRDLKPHIGQILPDGKWNFDLDDCDKILRVDCEENSVVKIVHLLSDHKFACEELE